MTISSNPIELELILVRHGQTQWNAEHRYLGHTDLPLLPSALEQLSQLKQEVGGGEHRRQASDSFWRVYSSDLLRCRETLAYIAPSLEGVTVYDQRLREMNFGVWEGCSYDQLKDNPLYRSWIDNPSTVTPSEGESWAQFDERLHSFLSDLGREAEAAFGIGRWAVEVNKDEIVTNRVLIVTHGGVIRNMLAQVVPEVTFYNAVAPSPGTAMALQLIWQNGQWSTKGGSVMPSEKHVIDTLIQQKITNTAPIIVMMCGVAGSGKTTFAQKLEKEGFVRLSIDEDIWATHGRYGIDYPEENYESYKEESEVKLRAELVHLIQAKQHVVVDFSFWQRQRRNEYKRLIEEHGGVWELIYLKVQPAELRQRLLIRSERYDANAAFTITEDTLSRFLSGFETPQSEGETVIEA